MSSILGMAMSSIFEQFFARRADVFAQPRPLDIARIVTISMEHNIEYAPPILDASHASA